MAAAAKSTVTMNIVSPDFIPTPAALENACLLLSPDGTTLVVSGPRMILAVSHLPGNALMIRVRSSKQDGIELRFSINQLW